MAVNSAVIIISNIIDANIKSYQPDIEFFIYRNLDELNTYLETSPIRAKTLYMTRDVIGQTNMTFVNLFAMLKDNPYISVDKVLYITEPDSPELPSLEFLIKENEITNWEILKGSLTKAFVTEVINGTARPDDVTLKHKAVYRQPRSEFIRGKLKEYRSLGEQYASDEVELSDVPNIDLEEVIVEEVEQTLEKVFILGEPSEERTAFAYLASQYLAHSGKTVIIESDNDYHLLTEIFTKSGLQTTTVSITEIYDNFSNALEKIQNTDTTLVVITCIDRIRFDYNFIVNFLYFNLYRSFRYIVVEQSYKEAPVGMNSTVVFPDTVIGCLKVGENLEKSSIKSTKFVAVNLGSLPETHIGDSDAVNLILRDVLNDNSITTTIVNITSLRLNGTAYDLGSVLFYRLVHK